MKCKGCGFNFDIEPSNETTDKAHAKGLCAQCYVQSKDDRGQQRGIGGLFGGLLKSDK